MNIVDIHIRERVPRVYIASIRGDADGTIRRRLREALLDFEPHAVCDPDAIVIDNADFARFGSQDLNQFLVDTGTDAALWGRIDDSGRQLEIHTAVAPYPKVAHENRAAARFSACVRLDPDRGEVAIPAKHAFAAALVEIARNRPAPRRLIARCITALENALEGSPATRLKHNVTETLSRLYALARADDDDIAALRHAIDLNTRVCTGIGHTDMPRLIRVLRVRAAILIRLGYRTFGVEPILDAVDTLSSAARHSTEDLDRARLDVLLADCKEALGVIRSDETLLADARRLLNSAVPYLYQNLAVEDWARAQSRLARVNLRLMQCARDSETGTMHANEAIDAVCEALTFYNATNFPFAWARVTKLMGEISSELGAMPGDVCALKDGISRFRDVLSIYTREHAPLEFATTSSELAASLCNLATHTNDPRHLESAESCLEAALEVYEIKADPEADRIAARLRDIRRRKSAAI